jgi:hypothetical protein
MPLEDWVQHSRVDRFLYDWQTLIAGVLALAAGTVADSLEKSEQKDTAEANILVKQAWLGAQSPRFGLVSQDAERLYAVLLLQTGATGEQGGLP